MIFNTVDNNQFDSFVVASDWRYSAAIVGLIKYLEKYGLDFSIEDMYIAELGFSEEGLLFNKSDIEEEKYVKFVEAYYGEKLQHRELEEILANEKTIEGDLLKHVNELLEGNAILKKVFPKVKFKELKRQEILHTISQNRMKLIKETFRTKKNMYANFARSNRLGTAGGEICRLNGYYVDLSKKGKSIGYGFNKLLITAQDTSLFDFIPFAFSGGREVFFINASMNLNRLYLENKNLENITKEFEQKGRVENKLINSREILWQYLINLMSLQTSNIEVISKKQDDGVFTTMYVRQESADILKQLSKPNKKGNPRYKYFSWSYSLGGEKNYIDLQKETMDCILNLSKLDSWIDFFLKESIKEGNDNFGALIAQWININSQIKKGDRSMTNKMRIARDEALQVSKVLEENKLKSYRVQLASNLTNCDYKRVCDILTQLSISTGIQFTFVYDWYGKYEENKELIYTFINNLVKEKNRKENSEEKK